MYIQLSERQQLGLERRFLKYSQIQKMANYRETLASGVYGGYTPVQTNGKEKNRTTRKIEGLL